MYQSSLYIYFQDGEFVWNKDTQGLILGSFYYGYMSTNILGGVLADRFGGKRVFALFMSLATIATLLSPVAARASDAALIFMRILVGAGTVCIAYLLKYLRIWFM